MKKNTTIKTVTVVELSHTGQFSHYQLFYSSKVSWIPTAVLMGTSDPCFCFGSCFIWMCFVGNIWMILSQ